MPRRPATPLDTLPSFAEKLAPEKLAGTNDSEAERAYFADTIAETGDAAPTSFDRQKRERAVLLAQSHELARRLDGSGVTANCFHPGAVATRLGQTDAGWTQLLGRVLGLFMLTPEQGASTGVFLATAPEVAPVSGRYFAKSREKKPAAYAQDDAAAKRLWEVSEALVGV